MLSTRAALHRGGLHVRCSVAAPPRVRTGGGGDRDDDGRAGTGQQAAVAALNKLLRDNGTRTTPRRLRRAVWARFAEEQCAYAWSFTECDGTVVLVCRAPVEAEVGAVLDDADVCDVLNSWGLGYSVEHALKHDHRLPSFVVGAPQPKQVELRLAVPAAGAPRRRAEWDDCSPFRDIEVEL